MIFKSSCEDYPPPPHTYKLEDTLVQVNKIEKERMEMRNKFQINRIEEEDEEGEEKQMEKEDVENNRRTKTNSNGTDEKIHSLSDPESRDGKTIPKVDSLELEDIVNRERESLEDTVKRVISERKITNLHIVSSTDHQQTQISFSVKFDQVEDLVLQLQNLGKSYLAKLSIRIFDSKKALVVCPTLPSVSSPPLFTWARTRNPGRMGQRETTRRSMQWRSSIPP